MGSSSRWLVVVVLLGLGAVALERAGWLPARMAAAMQAVEGWVAPLLREAGIELPPRREEGGGGGGNAGGNEGGGAGGQPPWPSPQSPPAADDQVAVTEALALLDRVPVAPERPRGYSRETWPHWLDGDGDCMNTRHAVLAAESLLPATLSADGCDVVGGLWRDAYTGESVRDPSDLDVDHVVPLAEAHRSGGHAWDRERRSAFANDLGDARSMIAVSASANRSKGDQGPEEWLPPDAVARCRYVADWVAVKVRWGLSMDERERVTVGNMLRGCVAG